VLQVDLLPRAGRSPLRDRDRRPRLHHRREGGGIGLEPEPSAVVPGQARPPRPGLDADSRTDRLDSREGKQLMSTATIAPVNPMSAEGKETVLTVMRRDRENFTRMVSDPKNWNVQTRCTGWETRDLV